jgi:hypothetical protein
VIAHKSRPLRNAKQRSSLLLVCAWCRKVKTDDGYWVEPMEYLSERLGATITHGICPDCFQKVDQAQPETSGPP